VLKLYKDLGFKTETDSEEKLKEKVEGLCDLCGERTILEFAFKAIVTAEVEDKEIQDRIFLAVNLLKSISAEGMWIEVKELILKEITDSKLRGKNVWMLFLKVANMNGQSRHVEDAERNFILILREHGYSIGALAFIFDRYKETISRIVVKG